jgi:hypothetical protein
MIKHGMRFALAAGCALLGAVGVAGAEAPGAPPKEASIPFANRDGIIDWQVVDTKTVLLKDRGGRWYKATLFGTCFNLPSTTNRLSFQSNPNGTFDKFSTIIVADQQRCQLASLVESAAPPKKAKKGSDQPPG